MDGPCYFLRCNKLLRRNMEPKIMDARTTPLTDPLGEPEPAERVFDALMERGWRLLDPSDARTYGHPGSLQYATFEHSGIRLGLGKAESLIVKFGVVMVKAAGPADLLVAALLVDKALKRQGRGRAALQELNAIADALGVTLYIEPEPLEKWGAPRAQLKKLYHSCGYHPVDAEARAFVRPPLAGTTGLATS